MWNFISSNGAIIFIYHPILPENQWFLNKLYHDSAGTPQSWFYHCGWLAFHSVHLMFEITFYFFSGMAAEVSLSFPWLSSYWGHLSLRWHHKKSNNIEAALKGLAQLISYWVSNRPVWFSTSVILSMFFSNRYEDFAGSFAFFPNQPMWCMCKDPDGHPAGSGYFRRIISLLL